MDPRISQYPASAEVTSVLWRSCFFPPTSEILLKVKFVFSFAARFPKKTVAMWKVKLDRVFWTVNYRNARTLRLGTNVSQAASSTINEENQTSSESADSEDDESSCAESVASPAGVLHSPQVVSPTTSITDNQESGLRTIQEPISEQPYSSNPTQLVVEGSNSTQTTTSLLETPHLTSNELSKQDKITSLDLPFPIIGVSMDPSSFPGELPKNTSGELSTLNETKGEHHKTETIGPLISRQTNDFPGASTYDSTTPTVGQFMTSIGQLTSSPPGKLIGQSTGEFEKKVDQLPTQPIGQLSNSSAGRISNNSTGQSNTSSTVNQFQTEPIVQLDCTPTLKISNVGEPTSYEGEQPNWPETINQSPITAAKKSSDAPEEDSSECLQPHIQPIGPSSGNPAKNPSGAPADKSISVTGKSLRTKPMGPSASTQAKKPSGVSTENSTSSEGNQPKTKQMGPSSSSPAMKSSGVSNVGSNSSTHNPPGTEPIGPSTSILTKKPSVAPIQDSISSAGDQSKARTIGPSSGSLAVQPLGTSNDGMTPPGLPKDAVVCYPIQLPSPRQTGRNYYAYPLPADKYRPTIKSSYDIPVGQSSSISCKVLGPVTPDWLTRLAGFLMGKTGPPNGVDPVDLAWWWLRREMRRWIKEKNGSVRPIAHWCERTLIRYLRVDNYHDYLPRTLIYGSWEMKYTMLLMFLRWKEKFVESDHYDYILKFVGELVDDFMVFTDHQFGITLLKCCRKCLVDQGIDEINVLELFEDVRGNVFVEKKEAYSKIYDEVVKAINEKGINPAVDVHKKYYDKVKKKFIADVDEVVVESEFDNDVDEKDYVDVDDHQINSKKASVRKPKKSQVKSSMKINKRRSKPK